MSQIYIDLHVKCPNSCHILMALEFFQQIVKKLSNIKFPENPSSGSWVVPCRQADRHDKANSYFSPFCKCIQKWLDKYLNTVKMKWTWSVILQHSRHTCSGCQWHRFNPPTANKCCITKYRILCIQVPCFREILCLKYMIKSNHYGAQRARQLRPRCIGTIRSWIQLQIKELSYPSHSYTKHVICYSHSLVLRLSKL